MADPSWLAVCKNGDEEQQRKFQMKEVGPEFVISSGVLAFITSPTSQPRPLPDLIMTLPSLPPLRVKKPSGQVQKSSTTIMG